MLAISVSNERAAEMVEVGLDRRTAKHALVWLATIYFCFLAGGAALAVALTLRATG